MRLTDIICGSLLSAALYSCGGEDVPQFETCEQSCDLLVGTCIENWGERVSGHRDLVENCLDGFYDECLEEVKDGYGLPTKVFTCIYDICAKLVPAEPNFDDAIFHCWRDYKHQG